MDYFHFCNLLKEFQSSGSSMGSYLSDTVPQLTKHSFAIFTSVPSNDRGEAGLRLLDWIKTTTLLILWKKKINLPLLTKKFRRMVPQKLQKTDNLCGFHAICSAFLLFKFFQKNLINVLDVYVLIFVSTFI